MAAILRALGAAAILGAAMPLAAQQPVLADTAKHTPPPTGPVVVTPAADQPRGVDAEIRTALFDLVNNKPLAALSRLEWLAAGHGTALVDAKSDAGARSREDLTFLLAESYYRLGLSIYFRVRSQQLLLMAPQGRYAGLIQMQMMLDAYRRGDYTTAKQMSAKMPATPDASLADFVGGLSAYQTGDYASARASLAKVIAGGDPAYTPYAKYMDALAVMAGDTSKASAALQTISPLASTGSATFADQVRLTSSQIAYQSGQFDNAATFASQIPATSGLAPEAQLARAWALYRGGRFDSAAALFGDFASRYSYLPGSDEARLMHGQILLEQHQPGAAEQYFGQVGDSLGAEIAAVQKMNAAMKDAAQALVAARTGGAMYARAAESGKSLMLAPDAGAEGSVVVAAFNGTPAPLHPDTAPPSSISIAGLQTRFDSMSPPLPAGMPRRLLYAPTSSPKAFDSAGARAQNLLYTDLLDAVARYRLQNTTQDHLMRVAALRNLQQLITEGNANLTEMNKQIAMTQDSVAKMGNVLASARGKVRDALVNQAASTQKAAEVNVEKLDSVKASLGSAANPVDGDIIAIERSTAQIYQQMAQYVAGHADSAIAKHPAFSLRDSLLARLARAKTLSAEGQQLLAANGAVVTAELARVEAGESDEMRDARQMLASADQQRAAAETQMVALVDGELRARASQLVAALKRSREAADYGSASAAFFNVLEAKTAGPGGGGAAPAPAPEHQ